MTEIKTSNNAAGAVAPATTCSPSSDTPKTDEMGSMRRTVTEWRNLCEKLERESNEWKANHDNQVALKRIIAARSDLKDRAPMVEKLMDERNRAQSHSIRQHDRIKELESVIRETIMQNLHLADGDVCTLKRLKDAIDFDLDSPENAKSDSQSHAKEP
jgi:hypothetical protein